MLSPLPARRMGLIGSDNGVIRLQEKGILDVTQLKEKATIPLREGMDNDDASTLNCKQHQYWAPSTPKELTEWYCKGVIGMSSMGL